MKFVLPVESGREGKPPTVEVSSITTYGPQLLFTEATSWGAQVGLYRPPCPAPPQGLATKVAGN